MRDKSRQQKIGLFFKQLDNTITLHQRKLDLLKEQKKLLTKDVCVGSITTKSPLENIERITLNIYNIDIGGYLSLYTKNDFFYLSSILNNNLYKVIISSSSSRDT